MGEEATARRALLAVYDKRGVVDLARALVEMDITLVSSGGTAATLAEAGATMADIVDMTSFHTDMPDTLGEFMAARDAAIGDPYPAWTAIGCTALAIPGARVEVKVTAVIDP